MSTAIMHSGPFYDFGDLILKNQPSSRTQNTITAVNNQLNNLNNAQHHQHLNHHQQQHQTANTVINIQHQTPATPTHPQQQQPPQPQQQNNQAVTTLQQQLNVAQALTAVQQAQQQQQKMLLHSALTRAVSHPVGGQQAVQLLNSINEILGHKKLERTQSEPLPQLNTSRYKTELCRPFEEAGECKYGDKCQFAHGVQELRNLQRHPKYKTELCRTFHSVGFCPYGPRCHFVHNAEEARTHNRNVAAYHARLAAQNAAAVVATMHSQQQQQQQLPHSPPLSMSTGSDRASPTGSLSLSPTNSMINFFDAQPPQQQSPNTTNAYNGSSNATTFVFPCSPPASPTGSSPLATTPPPALIEEARLPVFNRLSSTVADVLTNLQI